MPTVFYLKLCLLQSINHNRRWIRICVFHIPDCDSRFTQIHTLRSHEQKKHGKNHYQCQICLQQFPSRLKVKQHSRETHGSKAKNSQIKVGWLGLYHRQRERSRNSFSHNTTVKSKTNAKLKGFGTGMTTKSNLWWMPNSFKKGFSPVMKTGSSRRFQWYPMIFIWASSRFPLWIKGLSRLAFIRDRKDVWYNCFLNTPLRLAPAPCGIVV